MINFLRFSLKQFIYWFTYFNVLQAIFLTFFVSELKNVPFAHVLLSFYKGLSMNLSAAAYLSFLPILLLTISVFVSIKLGKLLKGLQIFLLSCTSLIYATDLALYKNWGSKINGRALWYLQFPDSVANSVGSTSHIIYVVAVFCIALCWWWLYKKYMKVSPTLHTGKTRITLSFLLIAGVLFVTLRGGLGGKPLSRGWSYYSKYPVLNYAAVNGFWNFFDVLSHYKPQGNPYTFFNEIQLSFYKKQFTDAPKPDASLLCTSSRPNVLFIYLESWGADVVGSIGGENGITPGFDSLTKSGLLFSNFYSTGFRTEQGLMATLSGFPAQAQVYPMEEMERFENYPNLIRLFDSLGYYTSYFTGGNPEFANTNSYLLSAGIKKIHNELLLKAKKRSAWGALDEETFDWVLESVSAQTQPFFTSMVTLTSHEWFEADVTKHYTDKDPVAANYKNTVRYSDSCLYDFIQKAYKKDWYKNTLIVIMADHACSYPRNRQIQDPLRYHIPMMVTGGALKPDWKGKVVETISGHLSIPAIMEDELKLQTNEFPLSTNPLLSKNNKAYFSYDHGFGVISADGKLVYDINLSKVTLNEGLNKNASSNALNFGKYLIQSSAQLKSEYQVRKKGI